MRQEHVSFMKRAMALGLGVLGTGALASTGTAGASSLAAATTPVTLTVEGWKGAGTEVSNVPEINSAFAKAYPNIKLQYTYVPPNAVYQERLQAQLLAGTAGDVIMTEAGLAQPWASSGYLMDLTSQPWASKISPVLKPFASYGHDVVASPSELSPVGLYSNLTLLKSDGISSPPATWPAFITDLEKLKAKGDGGLSFGDAEGWGAEFLLLPIAASSVYAQDPNFDNEFTSKKVNFYPAWNTAMGQVEQLCTDGYVNCAQSVGVDETNIAQADFTAGKYAFFVGGAWLAAGIQAGKFSLAFTPFPGVPAATGTSSAEFFAGTMWSINAHISSPTVERAAEEYVDFWSQSTNLQPYDTAEAAVSPFGGPEGGSALLKPFLPDLASGKFAMWPSDSWDQGNNETQLRSLLQGFLLGKTNIASTLRAIQQAVAKPVAGEIS